jgi:hypothetical protein
MASSQDLSHPSTVHDIEKSGNYAHLTNTAVYNLAWEDVSVTVKDRVSGGPKVILNGCSGILRAGMSA